MHPNSPKHAHNYVFHKHKKQCIQNLQNMHIILSFYIYNPIYFIHTILRRRIKQPSQLSPQHKANRGFQWLTSCSNRCPDLNLREESLDARFELAARRTFFTLFERAARTLTCKRKVQARGSNSRSEGPEEKQIVICRSWVGRRGSITFSENSQWMQKQCPRILKHKCTQFYPFTHIIVEK